MLLLYPVLGLDAFERVDEIVPVERRLHRWGKGASAEGSDTPEGFVVFKQAKARGDVVESIDAGGVAIRKDLVDRGLLVPLGAGYELVQDYVFGSPSSAAMVLLGGSANGRIEWKDSTGRTLKEIQDAAVSGEGSAFG